MNAMRALAPARRLALAAALLMLASCAGTGPLRQRDWVEYQHRFIADDGRVLDTANGNDSHSEGQGFGMLLAEGFGDRAAFDRIWGWTRTHLQTRRGDRLLAWRWLAREGRVGDMNNASDGDVLVAWALLRAARRWEAPEYERQAREILDAVRARLLAEGGRYLLPGAHGFRDARGLRINLSYWVFPALAEFERRYPDQRAWGVLYRSGLRLAREARYGRWGLPPDWLRVAGGRLRADGKPPLFSFDAIRVPLYLAWAGEDELLRPFERFWREFSWRKLGPVRVNLESGWVELGDQRQGAAAIYALCKAALEGEGRPPNVHWRENPHYYEASLALLAALAFRERGR